MMSFTSLSASTWFARRTLRAAIVLACACGATVQAQDYIPYGQLVAPAATTVLTVQPRTIELIDQTIRAETDLPRRIELIADFGRCPVPAAASVLNRLLADPDPRVRATAIRSLVAIQSADVASLKKLLTDPSPLVRRELVIAKLAEAIVAGVKDADPAIRAAAVSVSVNEATDRAIADQLVALDAPLQALATRTLGLRKAAGASQAIVPLLNSDNVLVRVAAIEALASIGTIELPQIEPQLAHAHSAVRAAATLAAMNLPAESRMKIATRSVADKDFSVRVPAARLLGTLPDPASAPLLLPQLAAGYNPLRMASREALVAIAQANAKVAAVVIPPAAALLNDPDADRRVDGSFVLGKLKSKEGLVAHIALLDDAEWKVVEQAAVSLGLVGDDSAGPKLVEAALRSTKIAGDADQAIVTQQFTAGEQAVLSAAMLKYTPVIQATKQFYMVKTAPGGVRQASVYALGVLGKPDEVFAGVKGLLGRMNDIEESTIVVAEGIKALGNGMVKSALPQLEKIRKDAQAADYQYAAHLGIGRINGTNDPFTQPDVTEEAETSIRATVPTP